MDRPNIVVLTIGRTGSSILCRMLEQLGWNLPDADEYAEHVGFRAINEAILHRKPIPLDSASFLAALPETWLLKDPRLVLTLDSWIPHLDQTRTLLLWLTRDLNDVTESLHRAGWLAGDRLRSRTLPELQALCAAQFEAWSGPKLQLDYSQIRAAAQLFRINSDGNIQGRVNSGN